MRYFSFFQVKKCDRKFSGEQMYIELCRLCILTVQCYAIIFYNESDKNVILQCQCNVIVILSVIMIFWVIGKTLRYFSKSFL